MVILISFVEDFRELFGPDESNPEGAGAPPSTPMAAGASQPASNEMAAETLPRIHETSFRVVSRKFLARARKTKTDSSLTTPRLKKASGAPCAQNDMRYMVCMLKRSENELLPEW